MSKAFDCQSLDEYISRYQVDGVMYKAEKLLGDPDLNPMLKNDRITELATTLALIPKLAAQELYARKIGKLYGISWPTFKKIIQDAAAIQKKKESIKAAVRKNKVAKLEGDPATWPFFYEVTKGKDEQFTDIKIDKYKFVQLLSSFGFTRYETDADSLNKNDYQFVRLDGNVIRSVTPNQIIDHIEKFILTKYDFSRPGCNHTNAEMLINKFYDGLNRYFSKDLFARVRTDEAIIINRDTLEATYFYYKNGYVEVTKENWTMHSYEEMSGSVWDTQMLDREFIYQDLREADIDQCGKFADFCWRISGESEKRFQSLCTIIGYLTHDYYLYGLKAILLTDSSLSEHSEGRTGKTLLGKMIGWVRAYCEINGKDFDVSNKNKYEDVKHGTQVVHLNDVKNRGRNRFDFEDVFNDVTEGFVVNAKYLTPFRATSKFLISTNKTLNIMGGSQRDRIMEFEMSQFFNEHNKPENYYGTKDAAGNLVDKHWFGRSWDDQEWQRFDNFMCFCSMLFHRMGLVAPETINLEARKLIDHTSREFIEYMQDIQGNIEHDGKPWTDYSPTTLGPYQTSIFRDFEFDKKQLYDRFVKQYPDFNEKWFTQRKFNNWLKMLAELRYGIKNPMERRSNGVHFFRFKESE